MIEALISAYCAMPNFPGKQRALKIAPPFKFARSFYGPLMARNVSDSTYRACMVGAYGTFISDFIKAQTEPFTFLDIGANQGIFSLCAARNPHCVRVVAFEPNPRTFDLFIRNIEANGAGETIEAINAAIADADTVELHVRDGHSGAASMFGTGHAIEVPAVRPSAIFSSINGLVIAKIDVEGAETLVLSALDKAGVLDAISAIVIEVSENISGAAHSSELTTLLSARGWVEHSRCGGLTHYDAVYVRTSTAP